jgi:hypothetical protein
MRNYRYVAAAIFSFHTAACEPDDYDPDTSGIEWWVQSRPSLKMHWWGCAS